jgi:uncharacterized membrane protein YhaH (DUF805 family)
VNKRPPWRRWWVPALEVIIGLPFILFLYLNGLSETPASSLPPLYWAYLGIIIIVFSLAFILPDIQMGLVRMIDDPQVREVVARHTRPGAIRLLILGAVACLYLLVSLYVGAYFRLVCELHPTISGRSCQLR